MEGGQRQFGVLAAHFHHDFFEGMKLGSGGVNVTLVHLVGKNEETLLFGESNDVFDVVPRQHLARGIAGVDDADGAGVAVAARFADGALQFGRIQGPAIGFVEIITDLAGAELGNGGRVERVLRQRDHDADGRGALGVQEQLHDGADGVTGARRQEDVRRIRGNASVALFDVFGHVFADLESGKWKGGSWKFRDIRLLICETNNFFHLTSSIPAESV